MPPAKLVLHDALRGELNPFGELDVTASISLGVRS